MKYEDFYPLNRQNLALIVTGVSYTQLTDIILVVFDVSKDQKIVLKNAVELFSGTHFRLGNIFNGTFVFSDNYFIYSCCVNDDPLLLREGEQPYLFKEGLLYKFEGKIYLNDDVLIEVWDNIQAIGRPTFAGGYVYFEARSKMVCPPCSPASWQIWRLSLETKIKELVLDCGANPYVSNGYLYYSKWMNNRFDTFRKSLNDLESLKI